MKGSDPKKRPDDADPPQALYRDALAAARALKRRHRALCERDPITFRKMIRKAQGRVFHRKPGPKADPRIGAAARERARDAAWDELYPKYIPYHSQMPESTRDDAESGFRRKVNSYLQRHPVLRRKLRKELGSRVQRRT